jgi:CRP/FNR family cyclic AMP-dependent transcriptional regulator
MSALAKKQPESHLADTTERVEHLKRVVLFTEMAANPAALQQFALIMEERVFMPGVKIITEGTQSAEMFILMSGQATVFKTTPEGDAFKVAILKDDSHAFFGEGGLIYDDARSATITSDTECHCLVLNRAAFEKFGNAHPEWALPFYRRISASVLTRLKKSNDDMMILYKALVSEIRGH